jgi:hypothetical protein
MAGSLFVTALDADLMREFFTESHIGFAPMKMLQRAAATSVKLIEGMNGEGDVRATSESLRCLMPSADDVNSIGRWLDVGEFSCWCWLRLLWLNSNAGLMIDRLVD